MRALRLVVFFAAAAALTTHCSHAPARLPGDPKLRFAGETHLDNIRQLTRDGTNEQAHWSFDGTQLVFQRKNPPNPACEQIFSIKADGTMPRMLSGGKGRASSGFFLPPKDERVLFSSTFATDENCPAPPYPNYPIYTVKADGTDLLPFEPGAPRSYNAETGACKDGSVVFTSDREGDLELYRGKIDRLGTLGEVTRITRAPGHNGGAAFSPDCQRIAWSASRPREGKEAEIWEANADGSHAHQVTRLGATSFAPTFHPDGERILFASNLRDPQGGKADLYVIGSDGTRLERVSDSNGFDAFPSFSPDAQSAKTVAFTSTRASGTQIFVADWIDTGTAAPLSANDPDPANRFEAIVQKLSSPKLGGRAQGTAGLAQAENFIADRFANHGLAPFFKEGGFAQKIEMVVGGNNRIVAAHNIAGTWGKACGRAQPVIVGAHLDPSGSDADGASGVAAMLEAMHWIQGSGISEARSCFVFAVFTGDDGGIMGTSRFVAALKDRKIHPKAMLNVDRAGRLENNHLLVAGAGSSKEWEPILARACGEERLQCDSAGEGYRPGDPMAFYRAGVPVLDFTAGPPGERINATGGVQISHVLAAAAVQAASPRQRLRFQKTAALSALEAPEALNPRPGHGAYLGAIPDYAAPTESHGPGEADETEGGVRLSSVHPGSPASGAGIKGGDVLKEIEMPPGADGKRRVRKLRTLEDYMSVLEQLKPGDSIIIHLRRGAQDQIISAEVGKRVS